MVHFQRLRKGTTPFFKKAKVPACFNAGALNRRRSPSLWARVWDSFFQQIDYLARVFRAPARHLFLFGAAVRVQWLSLSPALSFPLNGFLIPSPLLPLLVQLAPGVYLGGLEEAAEKVLEGTLAPTDFRFFVG